MKGKEETMKPKPTAEAKMGKVVEIEVRVPIPVGETAEELFENWGDAR